MNKKFFGLGKGLGSLIPEGAKAMSPTAQKENVFYVEVAKIDANPDQPRQNFDEEALKELAGSIRKYGVLQPLLVSKVETLSVRGIDVSYNLIAGERRLRAAKMAGLPHVPVIIRDDFKHDRDRLEVALIENVQREDLNPLEEAEAYQKLSKEFSLTQKEIADKVGKSREVVANTIRLLGLPQDIRDSLRAGKIARASARALLAFSDPAKQREVYQSILAGGVSSRDVETAAAVNKPTIKKARPTDGKFVELERNLADTLGTHVSIQGAVASGGKIIIKFASLEDLNKIAKSIID
ncbi:MAG: ParB/RepB/Spo0J family partition protein [Patescibacteria group bacterium]